MLNDKSNSPKYNIYILIFLTNYDIHAKLTHYSVLN